MTECLLFRADAGLAIGTGHVMRCLALAQAAQDCDVRPVFVVALPAPAIEERLGSEGFDVVAISETPGSAADAERTLAAARERGASALVVDGYHFGDEYQRRVKDAGFRLLAIDDYAHAGHYSADIVLNQNVHAAEAMYPSIEAGTRLLLGTRFAMLRREFGPFRGRRREVRARANRALVSCGGADPENATGRVLEALARVERADLEVVALIGAGNPHHDTVRALVDRMPVPFRARVRLGTRVRETSEVLSWADLAIFAAGTTSWEVAFMGLPGLALVTAENQEPIAKGLDAAGAALNLGWVHEMDPGRVAGTVESLLSDPDRRAAMGGRARELVDGEGAERVLMAARGAKLRMRPATREDCRRLWEWANEPAVRAASFSSDPIRWEDHVRWFEKKTAEPGCRILVGLDADDTPVGQVRFDPRDDGDADMDVSVDAGRRGKGHGSAILVAAVERLFGTTGATSAHAFVKTANAPSLRAFERAGFRRVGVERVKGHEAAHFVRARCR